MCQGHVDWEALDEVVDAMFGRDNRMIYLVLREARRILADDAVSGRTTRAYKAARAADAAAREAASQVAHEEAP
jgi:hypothetical protein